MSQNDNIPYKIEHLKLIQGVIERMGQSSSVTKRYYLVLVAAIFALSIRANSDVYILLIIFLVFGLSISTSGEKIS